MQNPIKTTYNFIKNLKQYHAIHVCIWPTLVCFLFICSIIVGIYIINYYSNTKEYRNSENCIMNFLSVVDADSLDSYLVDNHEAIIYISSSNNQNVRKYEQQLKLIYEELKKNKKCLIFE